MLSQEGTGNVHLILPHFTVADPYPTVPVNMDQENDSHRKLVLQISCSLRPIVSGVVFWSSQYSAKHLTHSCILQ